MNTRFIHKRTEAWAVALVFVAAVISGCATTTLSMPTTDQLVERGIVETDANMKALHKGRVIAIVDCLDCHRQYWPQEVHEKRWPTIADEMGKLAGMTDKQIHDLTVYMVAASQFGPNEE